MRLLHRHLLYNDIFKLFSLKNIFRCLKTPDQSTDADGGINRQIDERTDRLTNGQTDRPTGGHNILQRCTVVAKKKAKKLQLGFLTNFDVETEHTHGLSTNSMKHRCLIYLMSLVSTLIIIACPASCPFFIRRWKKCVWYPF